MVITELIQTDEQAFYNLCKEHQVKYMFAFGSSVKDQFDTEKSDIDLVVEIEESNPISKGEKLLSLWDKLEEFFRREVDLLTNQSIRNPYLKQSIDESKILVYDSSK